MSHATTGVSTLSLLLHLRRHSNIRHCRRGQCPVGVPLGIGVIMYCSYSNNAYKGPAGPGGSFLSLGLQCCSNSLRISRTKFNRTLVDCNTAPGAQYPIYGPLTGRPCNAAAGPTATEATAGAGLGGIGLARTGSTIMMNSVAGQLGIIAGNLSSAFWRSGSRFQVTYEFSVTLSLMKKDHALPRPIHEEGGIDSGLDGFVAGTLAADSSSLHREYICSHSPYNRSQFCTTTL